MYVRAAGQAIGADGEVMARGGGNGAYSGIQSTIKGPGTVTFSTRVTRLS